MLVYVSYPKVQAFGIGWMELPAAGYQLPVAWGVGCVWETIVFGVFTPMKDTLAQDIDFSR